jgi:hypothetical protein
MQIRIQICSVIVGLVLLAVIFQLIRRNKLQEKYSLLWIASTVLILVLSAWRGLLEAFASLVGVFYAPSALFLVALFCGMIIALHFSVVVSDLTKQSKTLAQEVALLKEELKRLKGGLAERNHSAQRARRTGR